MCLLAILQGDGFVGRGSLDVFPRWPILGCAIRSDGYAVSCTCSASCELPCLPASHSTGTPRGQRERGERPRVLCLPSPPLAMVLGAAVVLALALLVAPPLSHAAPAGSPMPLVSSVAQLDLEEGQKMSPAIASPCCFLYPVCLAF